MDASSTDPFRVRAFHTGHGPTKVPNRVEKAAGTTQDKLKQE